MRLGLFDILIMAGFGLWFLFPIGIYLSTRKLYDDTDQSEEFIKTHLEVIGKPDIWEEKENDWEIIEEVEVLSFERLPQSDDVDHQDKAA